MKLKIRLDIMLFCAILLNLLIDFLYYLKEIPCHYRWLMEADLLNVILCICCIILGTKIRRLEGEE